MPLTRRTFVFLAPLAPLLAPAEASSQSAAPAAAPSDAFHLGGLVFHPAGGEAVRIRFASGAPAASVTVEDGPQLMTARRLG